ncbi:MAG: hypothetical protein IPM54_25975 [Polyangiaceae bacterium]|nr:hypothetical protein [Polyangiaceae bacterium]
MQSKLLGLCGFLLFATFGMLSGVAQAHHDEPNAPSETIALHGDGLQRQGMSDEERERRQEECARMYEYCHDWCVKTNKKAREQRRCIEDDCVRKLAECMKKITDS